MIMASLFLWEGHPLKFFSAVFFLQFFFFLKIIMYPDFFFRWGQVFILDALSRFKAEDCREAENIIERVTPRLQHANCAVVLSAVKVDMLSN